MYNNIFGEMKFNSGWESDRSIEFLKKTYTVTIHATAYYESDRITRQQEEAYVYFLTYEESILEHVVDILRSGDFKQEPLKRYVPCSINFQRDGSFAVLLDDTHDIEGGLAVSILPSLKILSVDEFL